MPTARYVAFLLSTLTPAAARGRAALTAALGPAAAAAAYYAARPTPALAAAYAYASRPVNGPANARYYASLRYRRATRALSLRTALPVPSPGATTLRGPAAGARRKAALARTRAAAATYAYAALTGGPPTPPAYRYPARGPYPR